MIELLNPALAGGVAVVAAPIIVHIAHRRRYRRQPWGAMRFLVEVALRRRRRLLIEQWLLLAVRVAALLCLALALTRPRLSFLPGGGERIVRDGAVAAVLVIDDSASSGSGRGNPLFDEVKRLALAYLATLRSGDEISIIAVSRLGQPAGDPIFDREAARAMIERMKPTGVASDLPAALDAGLAQLGRHIDPEAELVVVSDGRRDGWRVDDRARWDELRRRLAGPRDARRGSRSRPRLALLAPELPVEGDLAVAGIELDRSLVPAGRPVTVRVTIDRRGEIVRPDALVRLSVDGRAVAERPLMMSDGARQVLSFPSVFAEPGSYLVEVAIEGARDALALDDRRALAVVVESHVPVLLVEGEPGAGLGGSLGLVAAALDPQGDGSDLFSVTRTAAPALATADLLAYRVLVLGGVPALDAGAVAAIERFIVGGGGVLVAPGPDTDIALANRFWSRGGNGFLPVAFTGPIEPDKPEAPATAALEHPALVAFAARAHDAWKDGHVRRWLRLDPMQLTGGGVQRLVSLSGGDPLAVERTRGLGRVVELTTSLDARWNDLPFQAAFVPLVRGLVGYLGAVVLPPRNLRAGERIIYCPTGDGPATLESPAGAVLPFPEGAWEGRRALVSEPLPNPGGYLVREPGAKRVTRFALAVAPEESEMSPYGDDEVARAFGDERPYRFSAPEEVEAAFAGRATRSFELWRWLVAAALGLLFVESALARRQAATEQPGDGGDG